MSSIIDAEDIIEIGRDLIAVKARLAHGQFLPWIEAEFSMGQAAAYRFMNVAEVFGSKLTTVVNLAPTALYELAAPKTPIEVREEVEKMIEAGEVVTKATVEAIRKACRAQADALLIESRAKMRLAEEYDTAKKAGEVAGHGGSRGNQHAKVAVSDLATTTDIGLSKQEISDARVIRDAETANPGVTAAR